MTHMAHSIDHYTLLCLLPYPDDIGRIMDHQVVQGQNNQGA